MKKSKLKILIFLFSFLILCFMTIAVLKCIYQNTDFSKDIDSGFYAGEYLKYNDGVLTVRDPNYKYSETYELGNNTKYKTDFSKISSHTMYNDEVYGTKIVYRGGLSLYIYDTINNNSKLIFENYHKYITCKNSVICVDNDNNIYLYDVVNENMSVICENISENICTLDTQNDYLYILREDNYYYFITVFDLVSKNKIADFKINEGISDYYDYDDAYMIANGEKVIVCLESGFKKPVFYDFSGKSFTNNQLDELAPHMDLLTVNGDYLYYTLRDREVTLLNDDTKSNESNGLYKRNITTGKVEKISDECLFDEIIATENYLYCYKINYLTPRSLFKLENLLVGYNLTQIPIN